MGLWQSITGFFKSRPKIKAIITDEAGKNHKRKAYYNNNYFIAKVNGKKHAYIIDHNEVTYDAKNNQAMSFYDVNNPVPIKRTHQRNPQVDSISFKTILDSKAITDLFSSQQKNLLFAILILIIINLVISIVIILIQTKVIKVGGAT